MGETRGIVDVNQSSQQKILLVSVLQHATKRKGLSQYLGRHEENYELGIINYELLDEMPRVLDAKYQFIRA